MIVGVFSSVFGVFRVGGWVGGCHVTMMNDAKMQDMQGVVVQSCCSHAHGTAIAEF